MTTTETEPRRTAGEATPWDLAVIGAGPAGCAAALAALRGNPSARVLLLDAQRFPRDKVCGDGIAPHAFDELARLGVDTTTLLAATQPVRWLSLQSPGGELARGQMRRAARVIPRLVFDNWLVDATINAGAVLRRHRVRRLEQRPDGVLIDGCIAARTVVGADGANSITARHVAVGRIPANRFGTMALAVRGYATTSVMASDEQTIVMTQGGAPAYAWAFPCTDGRTNAGYGTVLTGPAPARTALLAALHRLIPDVNPSNVRGHRLPLSTGRSRVGSGRILLAGDAAAFINPLSGEGIYYALASGRLAGEASAAADPATEYRAAIRRTLAGHFRHTDVLAWLLRSATLTDAAIAAAAADRRIFDTLVEAGLGPGRLTSQAALDIARHAVLAKLRI